VKATPSLDWLILTKHPERFKSQLPIDILSYTNVRLGVSIENESAQWRIPLLLATGMPTFISAEPLLGPIAHLEFSGIGWMIVGGESGRGARPMDGRWVANVRDRCQAESIPLFFKQWGEYRPLHNATPSDEGFGWPSVHTPSGISQRCGKKMAGRSIEGRTWDEFPEPNAQKEQVAC